ncbi:DUF899 domain-containing protein [Rugamonas sp. FT107W]|uniref:DUF899 domain-containing protein n=1 Tax=Duganella vulcania TaxID=2692166 RepID=A0A845HT60_9BURK|nr:DUF899 family protein [Duganella vulcania]MYN20599.1 DUF899 domain-containing protein [Duganella vulcania]
MRDQVARERRALPWVRVEKNHVFDTPQGRRSVAELFDGQRQLVVQHFMFTPGAEQGCSHCSYMADHTDGALAHLAQRDVTFVAVSRAALVDIERFRHRMGWRLNQRQPIKNPDMPGVRVFYKDDDGVVYRSYST